MQNDTIHFSDLSPEQVNHLVITLQTKLEERDEALKKAQEKIDALTPSYPKTRMQAKSPFLRRKETISAGIFIGRNHLQTMNLAPIVPSSCLNSGIQTQGTLRRKAGCLGMQVFGSFRRPGGNNVSEGRPGVPGRQSGPWPDRVHLPVERACCQATDAAFLRDKIPYSCGLPDAAIFLRWE